MTGSCEFLRRRCCSADKRVELCSGKDLAHVNDIGWKECCRPDAVEGGGEIREARRARGGSEVDVLRELCANVMCARCEQAAAAVQSWLCVRVAQVAATRLQDAMRGSRDGGLARQRTYPFNNSSSDIMPRSSPLSCRGDGMESVKHTWSRGHNTDKYGVVLNWTHQ
jgi:hypothetical protein